MEGLARGSKVAARIAEDLGLVRRRLFSDLFSDERGQVLVLVALSFIVFLGLAGFVVDYGSKLVLHRKAQADADAVALASVWALADGPQAVQQLAGNYMTLNASAGIDPTPAVSETSVDAPSDSVQVTVRGSRPTAFLKIFGVASMSVSASAQATLHSVRGCDADGCPSAPWGVPDCAATSSGLDCSQPFAEELGQDVVLKSDQSAGGKFYALQMPVRKNGGCNAPNGSDYSNTILGAWSSGGYLSCNFESAGPASSGYSTADCNHPGDTSQPSCVIQVKTGNIVGPTTNGLTGRLGCVNGSCNGDTLNWITGGCDPASAFDHFCPVVHDSPRLIVVPIVRNLDGTAGYENCASGSNCYVKIIDIVYFYIDSSYSQITDSNAVSGIFFRSTAPSTFGLIGPYNGGSFFQESLTK